MVVAVLGGAAIAIVRSQGHDGETAKHAAVDRAGDAGALEESSPTNAPDILNLSGSVLALELSEAPSRYYMGDFDLDDGDFEFRERVEALSREASYDPWLGRAAREVAFQGALLGESPPEPVLSFLLRSFGAPEGSVAQLLLQTSGDEQRVLDEAILSALENAPSGRGQLLVGIGEAATADQGDYERRVVVLVSRRDYQLDSTTRELSSGATWNISGLAPPGFYNAHASVLYPDNHIDEIPIEIHSRRFLLRVPAGTETGTIWVSIDGVSREGPAKLLQLQAEVGRPVPRVFEVELPAAESFATLQEAEAYAFALLNRDRAMLGLLPLILDPKLSAIGRAHSEEMRDRGFFGHLSATTGLASDRIVAAGYRASGHGENLAFNDSIAEAESSLLESVGHRKNIIATNMDHVGIGLAQGQGPDAQTSWHLTQVFARKVEAFDSELASQTLLDKINKRRDDTRRSALYVDDALCKLAESAAREALTMAIEDVPGAVASRASELAQTRVAVSVHVFYQLDDLEPDETSIGPDFARLGIGFARDDEHMHGRTIMVLISAE